jgi:hypothetical protein
MTHCEMPQCDAVASDFVTLPGRRIRLCENCIEGLSMVVDDE